MKKRLAVFLSLFVLLSFTACGIKGKDIVLKTASDESRVSIDLSDPSAFPKPDKIFYYHKGKEMVFESGTEEFEKIFSMNQARCPETLDQFQSTIFDWDDCFQKIDILEYWYDTQYHPLYFNITTTESSQYSFYWGVSRPGLLYGTLSKPTELLAYLNSLK